MAILDPARAPTWALLIVLSTVPLAAQEGNRSIRGLVSNSLGQPVAGVSVGVEGRTEDVRTRRDGTFRIGGLTPGTYVVTFLHIDFLPRTFRYGLADGIGNEVFVGEVTLRGRRRGTIVLRGTVTDSLTREPLAGVAVGVGEDVSTFTDREGAFRIGDVESGMVRLQATRIGYRPVAVDLELIHDGWVDLAIQLRPRPFALEGLRVEVDDHFTSFGPLRQLLRRRSMGEGHSFLRWEIEEENPLYITDLFHMVPGVRLVTDGFGERFITVRGCGSTSLSSPMAIQTPTVYLDGMPLNRDDRLDDRVTPANVEAVEFHLGAFTPPEFHNFDGCGIIAIWTR